MKVCFYDQNAILEDWLSYYYIVIIANTVPRGYVRLRSVDVTADVRKPTLTDHEPGYDYTYAGRFSDKASEAAESEEGLSDYSGSEVDNEEFMNKIMSSKPYLHTTT